MRLSCKTFLLLLAAISTSAILSAQTYINTLGSVMIRADSTCRSALISNVTDQRGDKSQLLGTGIIQSNDSVMECRSYLSFNLGILPSFLKAESISSARLVLFPMQMEGNTGPEGIPPAEIVVRRVKGAWEDSVISWYNQPAVDDISVVKKIRGGKEHKAAVIIVTKMVKQMLREGNYGFMISKAAGYPGNEDNINWFGSSKNQQVFARPVLLLEYIAPKEPGFATAPGTPMVGLRLEELDDLYRRSLYDYREKVSSTPNVTVNNPPPAPVKDKPAPSTVPSKD